MDPRLDTIKQLRACQETLLEGAVFDGIMKLENFYYTFPDSPYRDDFNSTKEMFNFMIEYFAKDTPDNQRENVYSQIQKQLVAQTSSLVEYYNAFQQTDFRNIYARYHQKIDYLPLLRKLDVDSSKLEDIFMRIWLTNKADNDFQNSVNDFIDNENISEDIKSVITSAITMSLIRYFDFQKLSVLFDIYLKQQGEFSIRALVGIILTLLVHENIAKIYPEIAFKLKETEIVEDNSKNFEYVFLQLIRSKETENIIKEFEKDILPQMKNMQNNFIENLDFEDFSSEKMMDDENPGWENYFDKNPEFFEKMEKFTMRQFDGSDIFSATLGNLKNFEFFRKASNWFTPFSADNSDVLLHLKDKLDDATLDEFLSAFEKASYFCNSDKFSFCLHIPDIAPAMREAAVKMLISEIDGTQEFLSEEDSPVKFDFNKNVITRYIQDLYRFYNFNNSFKGYPNIFKLDIGIHRSDIFKTIPSYKNIIRSCAELSFSQKFFNQATILFEKVVELGVNEADIYEKAAFSYQKLQNFNKALDNYKKSELFDHNKKWLFKKIGFALIKQNNYSEALEYYQKAEKEDPDDLATLMFIGRCYIALENYDEALKTYFKLDFFEPDNPKVMRSIALCSMMLDKYDQSEKYLLKTIEIEPTKFDFLNLGNLFWIKNDKTEAISYYITAISEYKNFKDFKKDFIENKHILEKLAISDFDIKLMLDYLLKKYFEK
ncbi:MAG: tetratricopeptide repeat protein [Bacteroidales bacterium]|nr:tetratricopeptide repeat protein [Bacteroidales bacterium]